MALDASGHLNWCNRSCRIAVRLYHLLCFSENVFELVVHLLIAARDICPPNADLCWFWLKSGRLVACAPLFPVYALVRLVSQGLPSVLMFACNGSAQQCRLDMRS